MPNKFKNNMEILKYGTVGLLHNFLGYLLYIFLTYQGLNPEYAVSIIYPLGATFSYHANAKYTFEYIGNPWLAKAKFILAHFLGYLINILILYVFVYQFMFRHELIQLISIGVIAAYLFFASKFFIFKKT